LGERSIVAAEMMAAADLDDLRPIALEFGAYTVGLVLTIKALNHLRIDRDEGGFRRCGILARRLSQPTGDTNLKVSRRSKAE